MCACVKSVYSTPNIGNNLHINWWHIFPVQFHLLPPLYETLPAHTFCQILFSLYSGQAFALWAPVGLLWATPMQKKMCPVPINLSGSGRTLWRGVTAPAAEWLLNWKPPHFEYNTEKSKPWLFLEGINSPSCYLGLLLCDVWTKWFQATSSQSDDWQSALKAKVYSLASLGFAVLFIAGYLFIKPCVLVQACN